MEFMRFPALMHLLLGEVPLNLVQYIFQRKLFLSDGFQFPTLRHCMRIPQAAHCDITDVRMLPWKEEIASGFHI